MTYNKLKIFLNKLRQYENLKQYRILSSKLTSLELYLIAVKENATLEERIEIIITLMKWINTVEIFGPSPAESSSLKMRELFELLDRKPKLKEKVQYTFTKTLHELNSTEFFCEVGLPSNIGLIGELIDKITIKFLPERPIGNQLSELMMAIFPDESEIESLKGLDDYSLQRLPELFAEQEYDRLKNDIDDSLIYLVSQITAIGLSPAIRKRIPHKKMKTLPFYSLPSKLNLYLKTKTEKNSELNAVVLKELFCLLDDSRTSVNDVYQHLNRFGVSTQIVFQLERMKLFLKRVRSLLELTNAEKINAGRITKLIAELVEQSLHQRHAFSIFSDNATFLAQKIIENNSQTGEHYIAKDRVEHWNMIKSAIGGGVLTAFTVYIKNMLASMGLSQFFYGVFSTVNYAGSFLSIHFCGFTLATKQPAATASALAYKLDKIGDRDDVELVTDEIVNIVRTQLAAVFGNLIAVIPASLLITFLWFQLNGRWIYSAETAAYTVNSTDLFGPSVLFAIFTGFLLWLSSVLSGWAMNWYSFHQLSTLLSQNKKLNFMFGKEGTLKLAHFLEHGITGIVGSIALGVFLGIVPELLKFFGIPLEVRHVTLSTGALAAAIPSLGLDVFKSNEFLRAVLGIGLIGTLNLSVSFSLALTVAFRAKKISSHKKFLIYRSVLSRLAKRPLTFLVP